MPLESLRRFRRIGWDFDETLLGHHHSTPFWTYIEDNPHGQEHFIITFRTGRLLDSVWHELVRARSNLMGLHFRGVCGVPEDLYENFAAGRQAGAAFLQWKGKQCRDLDIDVLVDDATSLVITGCRKFGVTHLHPDELGTDHARLS